MVALIVRLGAVFDALPEVVASHFDGAGHPNGYQNRAGFVITITGLSIGMWVLFAVLPALLQRMPPRLINLPYREFWLAPERRAQSLERVRGYMDWFGLCALIFTTATFELVIRANLTRSELDNAAMWTLLALFLGWTVLWTVSLFRAFRLPVAS